MYHSRQLPSVLVAALVAVSLGLTACGGGTDGAADRPVAASEQTGLAGPLPALVTLPQYSALRINSFALSVGEVPDAVALAALVSGNHNAAVSDLKAVLQGEANWVVLPPLTHAVLRSLGAAASGDSLAQIGSRFDLQPTPYVAARQTGLVTSQWWGDSGRQFRTEFLSATDSLEPWPKLKAWSAAEAGFANGSAGSDTVLAQALSAASPGLSLGWFSSPTNIRLLVAHSLAASTAWGPVTPFDGTFERNSQDMVRVPMLRLTAGVTRYSGSDFTADAVAAGGMFWITLRPSAGSLVDFAAARLEPALAEALQGLMAEGAAPGAGEMLLPQVDVRLALQADGPLRRAGVGQVFDEVQANLKGLDGLGGTYVQSVTPWANLRVATDGMALQAAHGMAFTFSPRNVHWPSYGVSSGSVLTNGYMGRCVWPIPDLRNFFLVLLDARGWVVSLAAIQSVPGTAVTPVCGSGFFVAGP